MAAYTLQYRSMIPACVIGITGYSDAGKTTLIERALPELKASGLYVGVIKHSGHHRLTPDTKGKDTDRFYRAGADFVFGHDREQAFSRHPEGAGGLMEALQRFPRGLDLILVEGHREEEMTKFHLEKEGWHRGRRRRTQESTVYRDDPGYLEHFLEMIHLELRRCHNRRMFCAGLLIGGRSARMGKPKGLLRSGRKTLAERAVSALSEVSAKVVLLGSAGLPEKLLTMDRLPDAPDTEGPLAGMLAAFRWAPGCSWLISAVDMPFMNADAWGWLLSQRTPGAWAIMPMTNSGQPAEPTGALYEPQIFEYVESLARRGISALQAIADHPKVLKPVIPASLATAWRNINTVAEWKRASQELRWRNKLTE